MNRTYSFTCLRRVRKTTGARRAFEIRGALLGQLPRGVAEPEGVLVSEQGLVEEGGQSEELHEVVLERRGGEEQLRRPAQGTAQRLPGAVVAPPGVAHPVGLVEDGQVPGDAAELVGAQRREGGRGDDDPGLVEGVPAVGARPLAVDHLGGEAEAGPQLVAPLVAQRRRDEHHGPVPPLRGQLGEHQAGLDGLAEAHLVGQDRAAGGQRREGEGGRLHLVGVQVEGGVRQRRREPGGADAAARGQGLGGDELVEGGERPGAAGEPVPGRADATFCADSRRHPTHPCHPAATLPRRLPSQPRRCRSAPMQISINGEIREVADGTTVAGLLALLGVKAPRVAVEVNETVVTRDRHEEHALHGGDAVEIVAFVGGG